MNIDLRNDSSSHQRVVIPAIWIPMLPVPGMNVIRRFICAQKEAAFECAPLVGLKSMRPIILTLAGLVVFLSHIQAVMAADDWWRPSGKIPWDWQLTEPFDLDRDLTMIDLDLFETGADDVARLKSRGIKTICYLNAGAWEDWREDANHFPPDVLGNAYDNWPGKKWLDIRRIEKLAPLIGRR